MEPSTQSKTVRVKISNALFWKIPLLTIILALGACQKALETEALSQDQYLSIDELRTRWLFSPSCIPPCWEGITPGQTTVDEAIEILNGISIFNNVDIQRPDDGGDGVITVELEILDDTGNIITVFSTLYFEQVLFPENRINPPDEIIADISPGIPDTSLSDLIAKYGKPDRVEPGLDLDDGWYFRLVWLENGLITTASGYKPYPDFDGGLICQWFNFFPPTAGGFLQTIGYPLDELTPWTGYAKFEEYFLEAYPDATGVP